MPPPTVFISYSHANVRWKKRLVKQLTVLELEGVLDIWDDRRIAAGDDWRAAIEGAIEQARVAAFLVSADFLTSEFIRDQEVPKILERRGAGLRVLPVIVESCPWQRVPWLSQIQGLPSDGPPLALRTRAKADDALSSIAEEIADLLRSEKPKAESWSMERILGGRESEAEPGSRGGLFGGREPEAEPGNSAPLDWLFGLGRVADQPAPVPGSGDALGCLRTTGRFADRPPPVADQPTPVPPVSVEWDEERSTGDELWVRIVSNTGAPYDHGKTEVWAYSYWDEEGRKFLVFEYVVYHFDASKRVYVNLGGTAFPALSKQYKPYKLVENAGGKFRFYGGEQPHYKIAREEVGIWKVELHVECFDWALGVRTELYFSWDPSRDVALRIEEYPTV